MARALLLITSCIFIATPLMAEVDSARQAELLYLLKHDCGSCHGMTLKGGLGPSLLPAALAGKPDELLVTTILDGRANTAMPPWKNMLTQNEAEWLTAQLREGVR